MLADRTTHTPEPDVVVPVPGVVPVAVRGAQVPGLVVEGAATEHPPPVVLPAASGSCAREGALPTPDLTSQVVRQPQGVHELALVEGAELPGETQAQA